MAPRRIVAAVVSAVALAAPPAALAQSAGDQQYQDPFGGTGGGNAPSATPAPSSPAPASPAPAPSAPAPAATAAAPPAVAPTAAASARPQLPYTGSPAGAGLLAAAGGILLASGITLRVRLRDQP